MPGSLNLRVHLPKATAFTEPFAVDVSPLEGGQRVERQRMAINTLKANFVFTAGRFINTDYILNDLQYILHAQGLRGPAAARQNGPLVGTSGKEKGKPLQAKASHQNG